MMFRKEKVMSGYVIICRGLAGMTDVDSGEPIPEGAFLEFYDPEAADGRGWATWTSDPEKALKFADAGEAIDTWRKVPKNRKKRPDGRPNRPLTAFTIEVKTLESV